MRDHWKRHDFEPPLHEYHSHLSCMIIIDACIHTYVPTYLHTYIPTYVHNIFILGADDMGISGDLLPRTLSRWHEHGFDPKHVQADDLRVVDHLFFFVCVLPFLGFVCKWHETMWHVWSLMTKSCVHAPLLHKGETKKNAIGFAAYVKKAHEMSSQLCLGNALGEMTVSP